MNYYILYIIHSLVFLQNPPEPRWNFIDFGVEAYELFGLSFVNETPVSALILPGLGEAKSQQRCPSLLSVVMGHCSGSCDAQLHRCRNPKRPTSLNHHRQRGACSCIVTSMVCSLVVDRSLCTSPLGSFDRSSIHSDIHACRAFLHTKQRNTIQYTYRPAGIIRSYTCAYTHVITYADMFYIMCFWVQRQRERERCTHIHLLTLCIYIYTYIHACVHTYTHI